MKLNAAKFFKEEIDSNTQYMLATTKVGETERLCAYFQLLEDWTAGLAEAMDYDKRG